MHLPAIVQPDADSIIHQWSSPGFGASAPDVRNAALIPPAIRAMMAPCWDTRSFAPCPVTLYRLRDVFVVGEGLVFDRDLRVVGPSMTQHDHSEAASALQRLRQAIATGAVVEDRGPMLLCQKRGMWNFGHWLIELLPLPHLCLAHLAGAGWTVLVPAASGAMAAVIADSLAMIGVPAGSIRAGTGAPRHAQELMLLHGLTSHGDIVSPLVLGCMDALMAEVPAASPQPLWISRGDAPRRLWNEAEVEAVLSSQGWRVVRPDGMKLTEQIAAFRSASAVSGVHGAGLTGIVFAPPGTPVTSFAPAGMPDTFFWLLSTLRGHRYVEVRAPHDRGWAGDTAWDAPLVLSLPQVLQHLGVS